MFIIKHKKIFVSISIVLTLLAIIAISVLGVKVGIDFKGGALTEVVYEGAVPSQDEMNTALAELNFGSILLQPTGDNGYLVKSRDLTEAEHLELLNVLSVNGANPVTESGFNSIGPSVGKELTRKAIIAVVLVALAIICFIAYAFRKVSKPVSSWKYGFIAIISLIHDIILSIGVFAVFSHYLGIELDALFVVAVLTILGLSVSDTIVVFDRIRENIGKESESNLEKKNFGEIVGQSLNQSFARSIATSLTTILVLLALFFVGPESTKYFALMLTAGMFFGMYSSIFLASPLLVLVEDLQRKRHNSAKK